jgi:hypothetical protein
VPSPRSMSHPIPAPAAASEDIRNAIPVIRQSRRS